MARTLLGVAIAAIGLLALLAPVGGVPLAALPLPEGFPAETFLAHWWIFPAAVAFATIALASGVSGALFFSPFFMLGVGLTPSQAIGAGLLTEVFGMGNGLRSYLSQGIVDLATAKWLLAGAIPAVVAGSLAAHFVDPQLLKGIFGVGLLVLGGFLIHYEPAEDCEPGACEGEYLERKNAGRGTTTVEAADGTVYTYDTCWRPPGVGLSTVGAFVTGLISAGLPEIVTTQLVVRCRMPPRVAVATSVFVLAIAAGVGALVHALSATPVWWVVAWSIPGVLVGGTVGTRVSKYVPNDLMEIGLGAIFGLVGALVLVTEFVVA